jgi:hypothetical protein
MIYAIISLSQINSKFFIQSNLKFFKNILIKYYFILEVK